ncbi:MAG: hypothetical protein KGZ39_06435 [Simkania sp.]|nr:hypothetical protein [Simkania sp.]
MSIGPTNNQNMAAQLAAAQQTASSYDATQQQAITDVQNIQSAMSQLQNDPNPSEDTANLRKLQAAVADLNKMTNQLNHSTSQSDNAMGAALQNGIMQDLSATIPNSNPSTSLLAACTQTPPNATDLGNAVNSFCNTKYNLSNITDLNTDLNAFAQQYPASGSSFR